MKATPLAAFGYVIYLVDVEANETREVKLNDRGLAQSGHYFYVKGRVVNSVIETGQILEDRTAGWLNTEHPAAGSNTTGTVANSFPEDSQWVCIPNNANPAGLPDLSSVVLSAGESRELPVGTDLYLVRGTLLIGDREFTGPRQIRIRSGNATAISLGESYSLRFE